MYILLFTSSFLTVFVEECRLWSFSLCNFLHFAVTPW